MLVKIAFFDKYVDSDVLIDTIKIPFEIVSKVPIFTSDIRLRKSKGEVYTYKLDKYISNITEFCYGVLYEIEVDDLEWFDYVLTSIDYYRGKLLVNIIETNYKDFLKNKYKIIGKSVECYCYTANRNDYYYTIYKNRHARVNFHKSLLINIL